MKLTRFFTVITSIQAPTNSVMSIMKYIADVGGTLVVAGDKKGPVDYKLDSNPENLQFLSLSDQLASPFVLAQLLPTGHYSRKNIAYLHAIAQGAEYIYETDDDNAPMINWKPRSAYLDGARIVESISSGRQNTAWVNVYRYFTDALIWPRGLPLDEIHTRVPVTADHGNDKEKIYSPIQQGLVNKSPDVDAIWRLVMDRPFEFEDRPSVYLSPGNWCPFNTQSTWWWPAAYPLLYIPSHCSFRMCDIWKSFIAQRCVWELGAGVTFHAPEVVQDRNIHDLMKDFGEETIGYDRNKEMVEILEKVDLKKGLENVSENLRTCYEALVELRFFPEKELDLVDTWISDFKGLNRKEDSLQGTA